MPSVEVVPHGSAEYWALVELRRQVLRLPLGLDFDPTALEAEASDLHLGILEEGRWLAVLVLTPVSSHTVQMRQVATDPAWQGRGLGRQIVEGSERVALEHGYSEMILHARSNVVPFYERLGYRAEGEEFEEVTIPHRAMRKRLAP